MHSGWFRHWDVWCTGCDQLPVLQWLCASSWWVTLCKPCVCLCELVCVNECVCFCISGGNTSVSVDIVPDIPHPVGCPECNMFCKEQITYNKHTVTHMHKQATLHTHFLTKCHEFKHLTINALVVCCCLHNIHPFSSDGLWLLSRFFFLKQTDSRKWRFSTGSCSEKHTCYKSFLMRRADRMENWCNPVKLAQMSNL